MVSLSSEISKKYKDEEESDSNSDSDSNDSDGEYNSEYDEKTQYIETHDELSFGNDSDSSF
ncbi:Hypothetical predicted protein [Paramuricea clavata]|uniref:Uncharacterized protein n=1 Tax=Paramuricea clavata TaxID=317549 RepID=A0A7D9IG41_PARCT|nr:Hypothetical predicted protein [Paramuricea clavata]